MAHALVQLHLHILHTGAAQQVGRRTHALAARAHRVLGAGDEQHGQSLRHLRRARRRHHLAREVGERGVAADGEHGAAQLVGDVGVHDGRIGADPVVRRARVLDLLGERAHAHAVQKLAAVVGALRLREEARQRVARLRQDEGLLARAADDGRRHVLAVARQVGARDEASHGMAEHDVRGLAGVAGGDGLAQFVDVLDERLLAVDGQAAKLVCAGHALAVADVIGGAHHEALFHEEARELVVAAHMLHHAVDDLNDAARRDTAAAPRALGLPHEAFDGGRSVMRQKADRRDCDRCIHTNPLPRSFQPFYPSAARSEGSGRLKEA